MTDLLHENAITRVQSEGELAAFAPSTAAKDNKGAKDDGGDPSDPAAALARILLFTDKPKTTVLAKALSIGFAGRLVFGQVLKGAGAADKVAARLGVTEYPTLLVIKVGVGVG